MSILARYKRVFTKYPISTRSLPCFRRSSSDIAITGSLIPPHWLDFAELHSNMADLSFRGQGFSAKTTESQLVLVRQLFMSTCGSNCRKYVCNWFKTSSHLENYVSTMMAITTADSCYLLLHRLCLVWGLITHHSSQTPPGLSRSPRHLLSVLKHWIEHLNHSICNPAAWQVRWSENFTIENNNKLMQQFEGNC